MKKSIYEYVRTMVKIRLSVSKMTCHTAPVRIDFRCTNGQLGVQRLSASVATRYTTRYTTRVLQGLPSSNHAKFRGSCYRFFSSILKPVRAMRWVNLKGGDA